MNEKHTTVRGDDLLPGREAVKLLPNMSYAKLMRWARERRVPYVENRAGRKFFRPEDIRALNHYTYVPALDGVHDSLPEDQALPGFESSGGEAGEC